MLALIHYKIIAFPNHQMNFFSTYCLILTIILVPISIWISVYFMSSCNFLCGKKRSLTPCCKICILVQRLYALTRLTGNFLCCFSPPPHPHPHVNSLVNQNNIPFNSHRMETLTLSYTSRNVVNNDTDSIIHINIDLMKKLWKRLRWF